MVRFWLINELFEFGLLPTELLEPFPSYDILLKLAKKIFAKQLSKSLLPYIRFPQWEKIAKKYLKIERDDVIKLIFDSLQLFCSYPAQSQQSNHLCASLHTDEDLSDSVNFYQLLVFLHLHQIQQSFETCIRNNSKPDILQLIKRDISRILQIISPVDTRVPREQFEQLDFLFAGGITFKAKSTILSLSTPFWQSSVNPTLHELAEWIKNNLSINSHCYPTLNAQGSPLRDRSNNITNQELSAKYMYETLVQLTSPYMINNVNNKTIVKMDHDVGVNKVNIVRVVNCKGSFIYLLSRMRYVQISDCSDCTIVVGVADKVNMINCDNIQLITVCKGIQTEACDECKLYLYTICSPIISEECRYIQLAPYNTHYDSLDNHLQSAHIHSDSSLNQWNSPVYINKENSSTHSLLPPKDFTSFVIPFKLEEDSTSKNPFELPSEFAATLRAKQKLVENLRTSISSLDEHIQEELQNIIETQFEEWLSETGHLQQIHDLLKLENCHH